MAILSSIFNGLCEIGEVANIRDEIEKAIQGKSLNDKKKALTNSMKACNDMPIKTRTIEVYSYCLSQIFNEISMPINFLKK